jgi:hypothetical protein
MKHKKGKEYVAPVIQTDAVKMSSEFSVVLPAGLPFEPKPPGEAITSEGEG